MLKTDIFDRAIPWTELILEHRRMPNDLNLRHSQRLSVALVCLAALTSVAAAIDQGLNLVVPVLGVLFALMNTYWIERSSRRPDVRLVMLLLSVLGIAILFAGTHHRAIALLALVSMSYLLLSLRYQHAYHSHFWRQLTGSLYGAYLGITVAVIAAQLPLNFWVSLMTVLLASVLVLNWKFYAFLATHWGKLYALAAIPFHLLYYFYSGVSFVAGTALFFWKRKVKGSRATRIAGA